MKTIKKYDTWMNASVGSTKMVEEGMTVMKAVNQLNIYGLFIEAFEFIGCAARVQVRCSEDGIEKLRELTGREWEEARDFMR